MCHEVLQSVAKWHKAAGKQRWSERFFKLVFLHFSKALLNHT